MVMIGSYYGHSLAKIVLMRHPAPCVSQEVELEGYIHLPVQPIKEN